MSRARSHRFRAVPLVVSLFLVSGCAGTHVGPVSPAGGAAAELGATVVLDVPGKAWKVYVDLPPWEVFSPAAQGPGAVLSARLREGGVVTIHVRRQSPGVRAEACFESVKKVFTLVADRFRAPFETQLRERYVLVKQIHPGPGGRQFWHALFAHDDQCLQLDVSRQLPAVRFEGRALGIIDSVKITE